MTYLSRHTENRNNNFKLLRFLAALSVLLSHSYPLTDGSNLHEPLYILTGMTSGTLAVHIFFFSSGFLVYASLVNRNKISSYLKARILRIYPALLTSLCLSILICAFLSTADWRNYFFNTTTLKFLCQNTDLLFTNSCYILPRVFTDNPYPNAVNGSLWTLPYEFRMYITLLFFVIFAKKHHKILTFSIILILSILFILGDSYQINVFFSQTTITLVLLFYLGAFSYQLRRKIRLSSSIALSATLLLGLLLYIRTVSASSVIIYLYPFILAYLVLYIVYIPKGILLKFNKAGDYSYGIYIYAFTLQQSFVSLGICTTPHSLFFTSLFPVLILAVLSWHYVEKPFLRLK